MKPILHCQRVLKTKLKFYEFLLKRTFLSVEFYVHVSVRIFIELVYFTHLTFS